MSIKDSMIAESGEAKTTIAHHLYRLIADEWLSYYQYWTAYNMSRGEGKFDVDPEFEEHAEEEKKHADMLMDRLNQLGGVPPQDPAYWEKTSHGFQYIDSCKVPRILDITIEAEQTAIDAYKELIAATHGVDAVTCKLGVDILKEEEEHLYDLMRLRESITP